MTVREQIVEVLSAADRPLTQLEIAHRGNLVPSSVRRTCQQMERERAIVATDATGIGSRWNQPAFQLAAPAADVSDAMLPAEGASL